MHKNLKYIDYCKFLIISIFIIDLSIIFNIYPFRQVLGSLFLSILPGVLILGALRIDRIDYSEKFVLSVGLSISFLLLFGVLTNIILLYFNYSTPFSLSSILISLNIIYLIILSIGYVLNNGSEFKIPEFAFRPLEKLILTVACLFPLLSSLGIHLMNVFDDNRLILIYYFLLCILIIYISFLYHEIPSIDIYPPILFLISISLIYLFALRSNGLIGWDVRDEYSIFLEILEERSWIPGGTSLFDSCLAISILPVIYKVIINLSSIMTFKVLFASLYSISPLIIYIISKSYIRPPLAFLSACFFMFQPAFLWTAAYARSSMGVLFVALFSMLIFNKNIDINRKKFLMIIFLMTCTFSHYATSYMFLAILSISTISLLAISRFFKAHILKEVSLIILIIFVAIIFVWYSQVNKVVFESGIGFISATLNSFNNIYVLESRGLPAQQLLGKGFERGLPFTIQFFFTWLTFISIGIGITLTIYKKLLNYIYRQKFEMSPILKNSFELDYIVFSIICSGLAAMILLVPFLSKGYGLERAYPILLIWLSVFFIIGSSNFGKILEGFKCKLAPKSINIMRRSKFFNLLAIMIILIPYFLSITGIVHQIFGVPYSLVLNSKGEQYNSAYPFDTDYKNFDWQKYYCEPYIQKCQARLLFNGVISLDGKTNLDDIYIYMLNYDFNVGLSNELEHMNYNMIYSNGKSKIFKKL
jgi:uncharacterized membrane protein